MLSISTETGPESLKPNSLRKKFRKKKKEKISQSPPEKLVQDHISESEAKLEIALELRPAGTNPIKSCRGTISLCEAEIWTLLLRGGLTDPSQPRPSPTLPTLSQTSEHGSWAFSLCPKHRAQSRSPTRARFPQEPLPGSVQEVSDLP